MGRSSTITVSAPCKVHLLGEHSVVYGKPAILAAASLRIKVTVIARNEVTKQSPTTMEDPSLIVQDDIRKVIEPIIKKYLHLKKLPPYRLTIHSEAPIGSGLGSSAAISACYIAALLSFLKVKWDLDLINQLTYQVEKTFQGNPSGADNATVIYGGLIWFRKESEDLRVIQPLPFSIHSKLSKNIVFINTGKSKEITAEMVKNVKKLYDKKPNLVKNFLENQETLVRQLLPVIKQANEKEFIRIIKEGEKNLESIGVCSTEVKKIIRQIESSGGAAKICGGGATAGPTGVLLAYHPNKNKLIKIVKSFNLPYFTAKLGVEGLRQEEP